MKCCSPFIFLLIVGCPVVASAQLRVVSYNTSNTSSSTATPRQGMATILAAIGQAVSDDPTMPGNTGINKRVDLLCLQESNGATTTGAGYAAMLNAIYNTNTYTFANQVGATTGGGTQVMVYDSATVQYFDAAAIGTSSTSGQPRQTIRMRVRPVGYGPAADIYVYNGHWKSSNDSTSRNRRLTEAQAIRADADALPAGSNVIYLGDLNVYSSSESAYQRMLEPGNGQAFDPTNQPGNWSNNPASISLHTQSPYNPSRAGETGFNGTAGGVDDRFDQQLVTSNLLDGDGVAYIPNSYFAFGNNGTHLINQPIDTGTGAAPEVLQALSGIADHLPVVADYQIPARMSVTVSAAPARVIAGANINVTATVRNSAMTPFESGADELSYTLAASGAATGNATGAAIATRTGNEHVIAIDTSALGLRSGTITADATSQAAADAGFSATRTTTVVASANPSFSSTSDQQSLAIDFGIVAASDDPLARFPISFELANRPTAAGFSSALDIDRLEGASATQFELGGELLSNVPADGVSRPLQLALNTGGAIGHYSGALSLITSDENIPGEQQHPLTLFVTARLALNGDATLDNRVNLDDFTALATHFGAAGGWQQGDFDRDGSVTLTDFTSLAAHFGDVAPLSRAVPEPTAMLGAALLIPLLRRR